MTVFSVTAEQILQQIYYNL